MISLHALSFGIICLLCFLLGAGLGASILAVSIIRDLGDLDFKDLDQ